MSVGSLVKTLFLGGSEVIESAIRYGSLGELRPAVKGGGLLNGNLRGGAKAAGLALGPFGIGMGLIFGATSAMHAPRGKTLSRGGASFVSTLVADSIGGLLLGPVGGIIAQSLAQPVLQTGIERVTDAFTGLYKNATHANMGGNYKDTEVAYSMRQRAAVEIGNSLLNARQYLGLEARYFHQ